MKNQRKNGKKRRGKGAAGLARGAIYAAMTCTVLMLGWVVGQVLWLGVPNLTPALFSWEYRSENVSMLPALLNTLELILLTLMMAVPVGIGTAICLVEYARADSRWVRVIRLMTETLQGIPSILFGLFGMLFFCYALGWNVTLLSGAMTLALLCLPLLIRATEEALLAVPPSLREASYALGASRLRTVFRVVLPAALPSILSGLMLAIGRMIGETAALIYTAGTMPGLADPLHNGRTLAIHMYLLQTEGRNKPQAYATAAVLLLMACGIYFGADAMERRFRKKREGNGKN
ncbi:MAG: phosphate ABC transporter permease PstA [Ndongobacter sp.]|nr:phosphate ABC transporter permease PstA [Ndongobacter sp.]